MRGRYYAKHTVNHTIDNLHRNKKLNENYKKAVKETAITYLRTSIDSTAKKVNYLRGLTNEIYRHGTKYKYEYECDLNAADISYIIKSVNDDALHLAYFGKTIAEAQEDGKWAVAMLLVIIIFLFVFLIIVT